MTGPISPQYSMSVYGHAMIQRSEVIRERLWSYSTEINV